MFQRCNVVFLSAVACIVVLQSGATNAIEKEPFGLDESIYADFNPKTSVASWKSDTELFFTDENTDGLGYKDVNALQDEAKILIPQELYDDLSPVSTDLSTDGKFALFAYDAHKEIGSVASARFLIYDIEKGTRIDVGDGQRLHLVKWGPNNRLVYVFENNIYYLSEPGAEPLNVTTDGEPQVIYNGILLNYGDLSEDAANTVCAGGRVSWAPDGSRIAFERYNASQVNAASFVYYYATGGGKYVYTSVVALHYPKAGTPIASVQVLVATLPTDDNDSVTFQELLAPTDVVGNDQYIDEVIWTENNVVVVSWQNRVENVTMVVSYDVSTQEESVLGKKGLKLQNWQGWVDNKQLVFGYGNTTTYLMIDWGPQGESGSFPHIIKVTEASATPITSGEFTVTHLYGWDDNYVVYFEAAPAGQPSQRHVYAVKEGYSPRCLSCDVPTPEGNTCTRATVDFSGDFSRMIFTCLGPDPPVVSLRNTANVTGSSVILEDNAKLREELSRKQLPQRLDDWVDLGDGMRAQVRMWLPPGLDARGAEKRPAVVEVYAGPETQLIDDSFMVDVYSYFSTSRRYVYIFIDARGSDCKGDKMLFAVYRRLGTVEIQDQIYVTKKLTEKYSFIDSSRVAIWGWSHGGHSAAMALARDDENVFRCGASVAPITDFRIYTAKFSECYMGFPYQDDNLAGYVESDVTKKAERFANKTFLLIHGSADDNVLYENTMNLARALEENGVLFRQQVYPDEAHSIMDLKPHVYRTIDAFFIECFDASSASAVKITGLLMTVTILIPTVLRVL